MELHSLFEQEGFDVPATHPAAGPAPVVSGGLLNLGIGILAAAMENGLDLPSALDKLMAARNIERAYNVVTSLRTLIIAAADKAGAAEIDGLSMADVIAEERGGVKWFVYGVLMRGHDGECEYASESEAGRGARC